MKFRRTMNCVGSISKDDCYNFEYSKSEIKRAKERDFSNPLVILKNGNPELLWFQDGEIVCRIFTSYYQFREGIGEHKISEFENVNLCSCGERFKQKNKELRKEKYEEHLNKLKKKFAFSTKDGVKKK